MCYQTIFIDIYSCFVITQFPLNIFRVTPNNFNLYLFFAGSWIICTTCSCIFPKNIIYFKLPFSVPQTVKTKTLYCLCVLFGASGLFLTISATISVHHQVSNNKFVFLYIHVPFPGFLAIPLSRLILVFHFILFTYQFFSMLFTNLCFILNLVVVIKITCL